MQIADCILPIKPQNWRDCDRLADKHSVSGIVWLDTLISVCRQFQSTLREKAQYRLKVILLRMIT